MPIIYDHFDDEHKVLAPKQVPEFCKEAELKEPKTPIGYADPVDRHYPINTPTNVWYSMEYFEKVASELPKDYAEMVSERLNEAAEIFGVNRRVSLMEKKASMDKEAMLKNEMLKFENHWKEISWTQRREYAQELQKTASALNVEIGDLTPMLRQYASQEVTDALREAVLYRMAALDGDKEFKRKANKLLEVAPKLDANTLITALALLDKEHGLDKYYDDVIPDPVLSVTSGKGPFVEIPDKLPEEVIESLKDTIDPDTLNLPVEELPQYVRELVEKKHGIK